jgi:hypothetical protein
MLDINKIEIIPAYSDQWLKKRRGKITASPSGKLISENSHKGIFSQQAQTYIDGVAGEYVTGTPAKADFHTDYTDYGNATESEAITHFQEVTGKPILRDAESSDSHRLVVVDELQACTPDALVCTVSDTKYVFDETQTKLKVVPLETKCPAVLSQFIKLYRCETPADLKKAEKLYYWQCIFQLISCDALFGYFAVYNPNFPIKMRIIEFKKMELRDDVKFMNDTIAYAKKEILKTVELFKQPLKQLL